MKKLPSLIMIISGLCCSCTKTTDTTTATPLATYTLGTGSDCTGATVAGRFVADTAVTEANRVTITVDVTAVGAYWITTDNVNGITFSQIGTFSSTGPQTAVLTATGTPLLVDTSVFTITPINGPGGSCTFLVPTVKGIPPHYYLTGFFNGVYRNFTDSSRATNGNIPGTSGLTGLDITGLDTIINSRQKIELGVNGASTVGTGTYTDTSSSRAYLDYVDSLGQTWSANSTGQPSFTISVTNVSATIVQGTFSGFVKNQQGLGNDSIAITNGVFSVPIK